MNKILSFYIVGIVLFAGLILLAGCQTQQDQPIPQDLHKFNSNTELEQFLAQSGGVQATRSDLMMGAVAKTASENAAPQAADTSSGGGASDYTQTNVQVEGVDEADYVKNDDKYVYMVQDNQLIIVDAYDQKKIVSQTDLPKNTYASNIFLDNDKVVVIAQSNMQSFYFMKYDIMPQQSYEPMTDVLVYDVSDRENPSLDNSFNVSGNYFDSRMVHGIVYLVAVKYASTPVRPPIVYADKAMSPAIYYFDNGEDSYNYNTIMSVDVGSEKVIDSKVYLLGYGNTLMMSEDNIYIAYQKQPYRCYGLYCRDDTYNKERFTTVVVPLLEGGLKSDIQTIIGKGLPDDEEWTQISDRLTEFYNELKNDKEMQDQYQPMLDDIQQALDDYDTKQMLENSKTIIHKISVDDGKLDYVAQGSVDGRLLNQYSMDEYNGDLRVATTVNIWTGNGRTEYNNVYVLDDDMKTVGSLENLATNESIYSTRFMGDRLYMATFKQIDPFFVIDLSNPKNPEVLGELKIPGYSSYLHPYGTDYVIGVGRNTGDNQWGGTSIKGVKISLYDVSDFNNPREVDSYDIGEEGTDTPILHDPHAFMLHNGLLVIPVSEITSKTTTSGRTYDYSYWDGAYVFNVSGDGFALAGKIEHDSRSSSYYEWYSRSTVKRSIIMDNYLITVSTKYMKFNDLASGLKILRTIDLPQEDTYPVYYGVAAGGVAMPEDVMVK